MPEHKCSRCGHVDFGTDLKLEVDTVKTKIPRRVMRDKREFDNTYHPGVENADLDHEVHFVPVGKELYPNKIWGLSIEACDARKNPKQLCHNCGWTTLHQLNCEGYTSRLKVLYMRQNSGIWELGPNGPWMLKDEPNNATSAWSTDYMTQQLLRKEKPNMPLVEMHKFGGPNDKFHFTIMARAKGSTIAAIWKTLTLEQKNDVAQDLKTCIKEWRQITRPYMQKADGSELRDPFIGTCTGRGCIKTGRDEEEWLENLTPAIRKGLLYGIWLKRRGETANEDTRASWIKEVDEKIVGLKANFPRGGPYVLTHGDLHGDNIFISDDNEEKKFKVSAIIDWELAGFFPWWAELIRASSHVFEVLGYDSNICHPGYSSEDFKKVHQTISPLMEAWSSGGSHIMCMHKPDDANRWYRPFCACKPYAQEFRGSVLGLEEDEHLDIFDVDSEDSADDDEEEDQLRKFPREHRAFLRWFNEINHYKSKH